MHLGDFAMGGLEIPLTIVVTAVASWVAIKAKVNGLEKSVRGAFAEIRSLRTESREELKGLKDDIRSVEKTLSRIKERLVRLESVYFTPPHGNRSGGDDDGNGD